MNKKYRLKKKRMISIIIIMIFFVSFFYIGIKDNFTDSNYKTNYEFDKEYYLCKDCNIAYFQTNFTPDTGYIFQYENEDNLYNLQSVLTKNKYNVNLLENMMNFSNKFAYLSEYTTPEIFEREYQKLQKLKFLKNTIIIIENKNLLSIKLPNLTDNVFIETKITTSDLIATLEEILDLKHKTPITIEKGKSFLNIIAQNTNYNSSIRLS